MQDDPEAVADVAPVAAALDMARPGAAAAGIRASSTAETTNVTAFTQ